MVNAFRRYFPLFLFVSSTFSVAATWTQPTPEELKMTSEPAAPDAAAIYLYREERADDKLHMHSLYVRLKVLTEKGKDYADVEIPYEGLKFSIRAVDGRTIHSDGTVVPFTGKPYEKLLERTKTTKYKAKVFTLPDVQVGSILEYRYEILYDDNIVYSPEWFIQRPLYVRKAHYEFHPSEHWLDNNHGGSMPATVAYYPILPKGAAVQYIPTLNSYTVDAEKIEPSPEEEFMPPMGSLSYRVLFYYTLAKTADEYWKEEGKFWSRGIDKFMNVGKLDEVVSHIVAAADTPDQKVHKIYDAVMTVENTSLTREHSGAEDKEEGIKIKTAADIWAAKRGNADEIAVLFVGLVRAAGLQAYVASVTNRDRAFFLASYLSLSQLDDDIAIVVLNGKDEYFDPGERYCSFGELHWKHMLTQGLRQTDHGTAIGSTPSPGYKSTTVLRVADLYLEADGKVHGTLRISMIGSEALMWRQLALSSDENEIKKEFEESIQEQVPPGIEVKTNHFLGLGDYDKMLIAALDVSGGMGTATSKRVFLPTVFFEAGSKPLFVHERRVAPVDLRYPYAAQDTVTIHLPAAFSIESVPKDAQLSLPKNAVYQTTFTKDGVDLKVGRVFILANSIYPVEEYQGLKDFYQKVNSKDQEQTVLQAGTGGSAPGVSGGVH